MAESDLIRGNVDTVILRVLYDGDRYGYDLIKQINAKSGGAWEIKQPTVYACLKRLEKQGFVSSYWDTSDSEGGRRKYYTLTDSGREVFLKYKGEYERASELFGGLIGVEPEYRASDDFADVEDEGYDIPKRPAKKRPAAKPAAPVSAVPLPAEDGDEKLYDHGYAEARDDGSRVLDEEETPQPYVSSDAPAAADPRSIIDSYYAKTVGESYSSARDRFVYPEPAHSAPPAPAPEKPSAPAVVTPPSPPAPAPEKPSAPAEPVPTAKEPAAPAAMPSAMFDEDESPARREYKTVLSDLVRRFEVAAPDIKRETDEEAATDIPEAVDEPLSKIKQAARELGADVTVRSHNDSAKQYTQKFYYYNNRLRLTHYIIMCSSMLIIGLILALTFYAGLDMRMRYDYLLYIGAGLLPIIMFITSVAFYATNIDKKKRIDVNFKLSVIIRCVFMIQVDVVIYCVNLIWGMPVGFDSGYAPSLIIPAIYSMFIPISEIIFMTLLKSKHYAVE